MRSFIVFLLSLFFVGCTYQIVPWGADGAAGRIVSVREAVLDLPTGPRQRNSDVQHEVIDAWHAAGHPHCYVEPSFIVLTDDEAKRVCRGVFACHRDGEIYVWFAHWDRDNVVRHNTIHWLLHCTEQPADVHHTRDDLWVGLRGMIGARP